VQTKAFRITFSDTDWVGVEEIEAFGVERE
jgi:hypothetical protein